MTTNFSITNQSDDSRIVYYADLAELDKQNNISYGIPLFFLQYALFLPAIFLCWFTITKILRAQGVINRREANRIMQELPTFYRN